MEPKEEVEAPPEVTSEPINVGVRVVDHLTNEVIPDIEVEFELPDGAKPLTPTNGDGLVEHRNVMSGICKVRFPLPDVYWKEAYLFVETGEIHNLTPPPKDESTEPPPKLPTRIVDVVDHVLLDEETLDDVAAQYGVTFERIAKFNWDTTDRAKVEEWLAARRGKKVPTDESNAGAGDSTSSASEGDAEPSPDESSAEPATSVSNESESEAPRLDPIGNAADVRPVIMIPKELSLAKVPTDEIVTVRVYRHSDLAYISLVLYDDFWAAPLPDKPYQVLGAGGSVIFEGRTDENGFLEHGPVEMDYYVLRIGELTPLGSDTAFEEPPSGEFSFTPFQDLLGTDGSDISVSSAFAAPDSVTSELPVVPEAPKQCEISFVISAVRDTERRYDQRVPWSAPAFDRVAAANLIIEPSQEVAPEVPA